MARKPVYVVRLSDEERQGLEQMVRSGKRAARTLTRARIVLAVDRDGRQCWSDEQVVAALGVGSTTVHRVRQALVEEGLEATLVRKKPTGRQYRKLDGAQEARLTALACSAPPEGRVRWTLQLLADRMVELKIVDTISDDTVGRTLKKTTSSRGGASNGCCPPNKRPRL